MGTDTPLSPPKTTATVQPPGLTLEAYADAKRLPVEELTTYGLTTLASKTQEPKVRIPYRFVDGRESNAVRYRMSLEGTHRFTWRKGSKLTPYGFERLADARAHGSIVVVEGESDCHTLWHHEIPAVGVPGASTFKSEWLTHLDDIPTIYVIIEPDRGGEQMLSWIAKQPSEFTDRVRLVRLTDHKDPSDLHVDDPDSFKSRFGEALGAAEPWAHHEAQQRNALATDALAKCEPLAKKPDILRELDRSLERSGLVGERPAAYLSYLAITSHVLDEPVSVVIKGPSSAGKNHIVKKVLEHFPDDAYVQKTGMSPKAIFYGEEDLRHRMLVLIEWRGVNSEGEYPLESLLSEGHVKYETVDQLQTRTIERPGPTGLLTTTTRAHIAGDMENRLFAVTITDTPEQTKRVFQELAIDRPERTEAELAPWRALQEYIASSPASVSMPYKHLLAELIPPVTVRLRRDVGKLLRLIETHALWHQATRDRDATGATVATLTDYDAVRSLVHDLLTEGAHVAVSETIRQTVEAVQALLGEPGEGVTNAKVARHLRLDNSATSRRVSVALNGGYLTNLESNPRRPKKLVIGDPLPADQDLLPTPERLEWEMAKADGRHSTELPPGFYGCTVAVKLEGEGG